MEKKGALLFCVCRGKVSEGIDFPNQLCRAVVFVGIPFPNVMDHTVKAKKDHLTKIRKMCPNYNFSGDMWYENNTFRAVSQAIGRVIRHINDFGSIYLLDTRFNFPSYRAHLPKWAMRSYETIQRWSPDITEEIS